MESFIELRKIPANEAVIMAGDFNINQFKENDDKFPNKDIFNHMKDKLNAQIPVLKGAQCIKDNDIAGIKESCTPSRIDYVVTHNNYRKVTTSFNEFVIMRTSKPWDKEGKHYSLSDHEGMHGYFEFVP